MSYHAQADGDGPVSQGEERLMDALASVEPQQGRTVRAAGRDIFVVETGDGPPLLMLHGGGPGASGLPNFVRNVSALAERFRLIVPDMPGFGRSTKGVDRKDPFGDLADGDAGAPRRARRRTGACARQLARRRLRVAHGARGAGARRPPGSARPRRHRHEPQAADRGPSPSARLLCRRGPDPGKVRDSSCARISCSTARRCPTR